MISAQIGQAHITVKKRQSLFNAMNIFDGLSSKMFFIEFLDCNECVYRILCKASEFSCFKMIFLYSSDYFIYIFNRTVNPF